MTATSTTLETPAPRRGRPPKVSAEAILDAVDRKRDADWTMAGIAAELGVSEPTIYYHFPSKQALLGALGTRVIEQLPLPAPSEDWEAWLEEFALGALDFCRRHPFLSNVDMSSIAVQQSASVRFLDEMLRHLGAYGFIAEDAVLAVASVLLVVQQFAHVPAYDVDANARLAALAHAEGATLAEGIYHDDPYLDVDATFRRMLRIVLAGVRSELVPRSRRRKARV